MTPSTVKKKTRTSDIPHLAWAKAAPWGVYFTGLSRYKEQFAHDLGHLFEQYIGRQLRLLPGAQALLEITYGLKSSRKTVDWIVVLPEVVVLLVEVKSAIPPSHPVPLEYSIVSLTCAVTSWLVGLLVTRPGRRCSRGIVGRPVRLPRASTAGHLGSKSSVALTALFAGLRMQDWTRRPDGVTVSRMGWRVGSPGVTSTVTGSLRRTTSGISAAFIAELSSDGSTLMNATYLGGRGRDQGNGIALDGQNNVYVTGVSNSPGLATSGAAQTTGGSSSTPFVASLNSGLSALNYYTYLGGSFEIRSRDGYFLNFVQPERHSELRRS